MPSLITICGTVASPALRDGTRRGSCARATFIAASCTAMLGIGTACSELQNPSAPHEDATPTVAAIRMVAALRPAPALFDDAFGRLLPSFADQTRAADLGRRLGEFSAAYEAGDDAGARIALERARKLVDDGGAHDANLSALRLAIRQADDLVDEPSDTEISDD